MTSVDMKSVLCLRGVDKGFVRGRRVAVRVLRDVSLEIALGEVVAVLAQRAQGKSTLLRVAAGLERPEEGRVLYCGQDIWEMSAARRSQLLSREIGWVSRTPPDLDVPVMTLVALPLFAPLGREEAYVQAKKTLKQIGAERCAEQHWESLADWERALVALGQGMAREPKLLLVDDLTTTLGLSETEEIVGLLRQAANQRQVSVLLGASDATATKAADRIATLAAGELLVAPITPTEDNLIDLSSRASHRDRRHSEQ